jgi:hypothetical protein
MATNFRTKAAGRSADTEAAIRDALMAGDSAEAVTVACAALRSERTWWPRSRPLSHGWLMRLPKRPGRTWRHEYPIRGPVPRPQRDRNAGT